MPDTPSLTRTTALPWAVEQDIERARDGIDSFAGDGSSEREAFERLVAWVRGEHAAMLRAEAVLVAADRVREAYDAMVEGRDLGSLPDWTAHA